MPGPWGKAIERLRVDKGWSRDAAAKKARMTATTYGRIERGHHTQTQKLQDIADVFGVPIEAVLQIQPLQSAEHFGQTVPISPRVTHGQGHASSLQALESEVRSQRLEIAHLQQTIAEIVASREAQSRYRRRKRVSTTSTGKSARVANARKPR